MSIENINSKLDELEKFRQEYNEIKVAKNYTESEFYKKDVLDNEENFDSIDKSVTDVKDSIDDIIKDINNNYETKFYNTESSLQSLKKSIPTNITENIRSLIRKTSETSHKTFLDKYNSYYETCSEYAEKIKLKIERYKKLDSEISNLGKELNRIKAEDHPNHGSYNSWNRQRLSKIRERNTIPFTCQTYLTSYEGILKKIESELISKGKGLGKY